jgi:hypothetical protein
MKSTYLIIVTLVLMMIFSIESRAQTCPDKPDAQIAASPTFVYDAGADSMIITVPVKNVGGLAFASPFKITVYKNEIDNVKRYTFIYNSAIAAGTTANITFGIGKFKAEWTPFDNIVIRLNDKGNNNGNNDQPVCGIAQRDYIRPQIIASDDRMLVFNDSDNNQFRVAINDILPMSYISLTVNILAESTHTGEATVSGSTVFYKPAAGQTVDTIRYRIHCGDALNADTATIYVKIMDKADNIGDAECFVEPSGSAFTFKELASTSGNVVNNYSTPLAGDIDNDGYMEIVIAGVPVPNGVSTDKLYIFKYKDGQVVLQQTLNTPRYNTVSSPYAIAKVDGNDYAAIFLCTDNTKNSASGDKLKLIKYVYNGTQYVEFQNGTKRGTYSDIPAKEMVQPMIADFDGNGIPEVVTYDRVFNARTMEMLVNGNLLSNSSMGFGNGSHFNNNNTSEPSSIMAVGDMDNDGHPEVVGGHCAYKVTITNPDGMTGNSFELWHQCNQTGPGGEAHPEAKDGPTAIADIDNDGFLDVIVTVSCSQYGGNQSALYIWNPYTQKVLHTNIVNTLPAYGNLVVSPSVPFVGDIDADGKPEICFIGVASIFAYELDGVTLKQIWTKSTIEDTGATSMVMFDFNQDGKNELVYRDGSYLRILIGESGDDLIDPTDCFSPTGAEYPLVVDINKDGAAEIVVTGDDKVRIFSSNPVGKWAPARKVWNQYAYNAVNINENLTVPTVQLNPSTVFPGPDGQLGTSDDVRPYNGYLQQQTTLSKSGTPYWEASDYAIENVQNMYYQTADSLVITFCVRNHGDIQGATPFHVSVYKNERQAGNMVVTKSFDNIPASEGIICGYSIKVENVTTNTSVNSLHLWLNDQGEGKVVNPECDTINGSVSFHVTGIVTAQDDYASVFVCEETNIDILDNDEYAGTTFSILKPPKYGTTDQAGGHLIYKNIDALGLSCTGNRIDTIRYKIESILMSDEADVIVKIYNKPEMILEDSCSVNPKIVLSNSYDGFTYEWGYSLNGETGWEVIPDNNATKLSITKGGFYRVTITYDNGKTHQLQKGIQVTANKTVQLPGGITWYEFSSNTVNITWQSGS